MGFGKRNIKFFGGRILKYTYTLSVVMAVALAFLFIVADIDSDSSGTSQVASETAGGIVLPDPVAAPSADEAQTGKANADKKAGSDGTLSISSTTSSPEVYSQVTLADGQQASVRWDGDTGIPAFLTGDIAAPASDSIEGAALAFLGVNGDLYRMSEPEKDLKAERSEQDDLGMSHLYFGQTYEGVPVFGSDVAVHFSAGGRIVAVNGRYVPDISLSTEPSITADDAARKALEALGVEAGQPEDEPAELVILTPGGGDAVLTWKVTLVADEPPLRMIYFINAQSGEVAGSYDDLEDVRNRNTYTASNGTSLPGTLLISEGGSSGDSVAQAAHNNTGTTYDYYYNTFGRDSFNGAGATLKTTVHYSSRYNNAFWNGSQMVYGDGDGSVFSPLGSSLDVVAHELTHAVTQYTAGLIYSYQSGALNESYSDVFGVMVDRDDWLLGDDVYTPATPGDALRSLSNPTQYGQPAHMNNYVNTSSDNGGVHTNSGIPNKAAYNIATAIGKDKMEKIWYRTLTMYLTSGSEFTDARDASVQAAEDLYGASSAEVTAVQNGFSAVGISGGQTSATTARIEIDHTYRGDLVVTLGVGDPAAPTWSTTVSNQQGGSADNLYTTVDIAGGVSYLPPSWQNRWFLKIYDAASYDVGQIKKFTITDNGTTYTATDVPVAVNDFQTSYSYIPTSDSTPPTVQSTSPASGAIGVYASSSVSAVFSEQISSATVTGSSFTLKRSQDGATVPAQLSYSSSTMTATLDPSADLNYSTAYDVTITTAVTDLAGNPLVQNKSWSFTTAPAPKYYYFTWYDMSSAGMRDWVVMGNPAGSASQAGFDVYVGSDRKNSSPVVATAGQTQPVTFPGTIGGPVKIAALEGSSKIISKRTLYGNSFEEMNAIDSDRLDSHYYFTWYDAKSSGAYNWVLVSNQGTSAVEADVYIAGQKMNASPYRIEAGSTVTPMYSGVMGGPVEVFAYEPGSPSVPRQVIASQRIIWNGSFKEIMGIPASELGSDYLFTWYDQKSSGATNWVLIGNPSPDKELVAEIWIGGQKMTNGVNGDEFFTIAAGESITPTFPTLRTGPVEVKGYDAATYNPASPGTPNMEFFTTQRSIFAGSFEEVAGYSTDRLSPVYHYSWYDQANYGSLDWVLISNPGSTEVKAEVWIAGARVGIVTVAPGASQAPSFNGVVNGPVEVRGYDSATYNPDSPGTPNRNVFSSQRVLWNGSFSENEGIVLQ